jgi:hypothetical protein
LKAWWPVPLLAASVCSRQRRCNCEIQRPDNVF